MRKYLKIKTMLTGFAWVIIFLHGIIPHDHDYSSLTKPQDSDHHYESCYCADAEDYIGDILNELCLENNQDHHCCHFNPVMHNIAHPEINYIAQGITVYFYYREQGVSISIPSEFKSSKTPLLESFALRAPPVS